MWNTWLLITFQIGACILVLTSIQSILMWKILMKWRHPILHMYWCKRLVLCMNDMDWFKMWQRDNCFWTRFMSTTWQNIWTSCKAHSAPFDWQIFLIDKRNLLVLIPIAAKSILLCIVHRYCKIGPIWMYAMFRISYLSSLSLKLIHLKIW